MKLYTAKDMVKVVDEAGNDLAPVPKSWLGTDLLPVGVKAKKGGSKSEPTKSKSEGGSKSKGKPEGEPAGNASAAEWESYAREFKGASEDDLKDEAGEPLGRDALRAKFGTKS